jgi:hypothetical protein
MKCDGCGKTWEFDCPDCAVKERMAVRIVTAIERSDVVPLDCGCKHPGEKCDCACHKAKD